MEGLAVVAERLAVVAGDDDDRPPLGGQCVGRGDELAHPAVDLAEQVIVEAAALDREIRVTARPFVQLDEVDPREGGWPVGTASGNARAIRRDEVLSVVTDE